MRGENFQENLSVKWLKANLTLKNPHKFTNLLARIINIFLYLHSALKFEFISNRNANYKNIKIFHFQEMYSILCGFFFHFLNRFSFIIFHFFDGYYFSYFIKESLESIGMQFKNLRLNKKPSIG